MTIKKIPLEHAALLSRLHYDPETGSFKWLNSLSVNHPPGCRAGYVGMQGYYYITLNGTAYLAHRIAFYYMTGKQPGPTIDHINREILDNRWINLRETTHAENMRNRGPNKSGLPRGVRKRRNRFHAVVEGRSESKRTRLHLGSFTTPEEAHQAYLDYWATHSTPTL